MRPPARGSMKPMHILLFFVCVAAATAFLRVLTGAFRFGSSPSGSDGTLDYPSSKSKFYEGFLLATRSPRGGLGGASPPPLLRVYMYDLPPRFNLDIVTAYWTQRGKPKGAARRIKNEDQTYPNHQHSAEWHLYSSLKGGLDAPGRLNPTAVRVSDPADADVFFVPFFSSLSLKVDPISDHHVAGERSYSDEETSKALVAWLREQDTWQQSGGRDHVFPGQHPNALRNAMHDVRSSVLLLSDFDRPGPLEASLAKDVVLPYVHRVKALPQGEEISARPTLLFFIGVKLRKKGGKIRADLFRVLEGEEGVVMAEGTQGRTGYNSAQEGMRSSKFCLHPEGDTPSGGRIFDAIVSGCVPVIVSDLIELPFEGLLDYSQFSVFVPSQEAIKPGHMVSMLREMVPERLQAMQKRLAEVRHHFSYDSPDGAVNMVWRAVAGKVPWIKEQIARDHRMVSGGLKSCHCKCANTEDELLCSAPARAQQSGRERERKGAPREL